MARKSKSSIQKTWEDRLNKAKKCREDWARQFRVDMAWSFFEGKQNPGYPENEWITINKIYSHLQASLPQLYSVDPYFYVKTKKSFNPDPNEIAIYDQRAKTRQAMLNYLKGEVELKTKARLSIQDAHFSYGVCKTHYHAEEKKNPKAGEQMYGDNEEPLTNEANEPLMEPDVIPVNERYAVTRVDPDDFLWDDDAGPTQDKWCWVAERSRLTKDEAEKLFNAKTLKLLKANRDGNYEGIGGKPDKEKEVYNVWEIYDLKNKKWLKICEDAYEPIQMPEDLPPGVEDHPYSVLRFTLRSKSPYPIPPVSQSIDPQKEYCMARSQVLTHRKRFNRKYEVVESKLVDPDVEITKLETGDDGTCIKVMANGAVTPINDAPMDQGRYLEIQALNNDIVEAFGTPDEARGLASADSATQADIIDRRLEVREGDRMSVVVDFITSIGRKMDQLVQAHISREEAVRVMGPQGEMWHIVRESDYEKINGEFEYSLNVGASMPRLPQIERAQWTAFMTGVVIPMPQILTAPQFMKKMAEMYGIEDEGMLEELRQLGLKMMSGQMPMPGAQGSQPGVSNQNPLAAVLGTAMGPLGGNANGGGAPGGMNS